MTGIEEQIEDSSSLKAGDDAEEAILFPFGELPKLAFPCHEKIVNMYRKKSLS